MPVRFVDPEEFERLTGLPRVRWTIGFGPARRPTPSQKMQAAEDDKPRWGLVYQGHVYPDQDE